MATMEVSAELISLAKKVHHPQIREDNTDFDEQIQFILGAGLLDLGVAGVEVPSELDDLVKMALMTYFELHFGQPDDYERLRADYESQKGQLSHATGYTDWTVTHNG